MPWQQRALFYTSAIGELHYASNFYARMLQRLRIYPAYQIDDDTTVEINSGPAVEAMRRIQDPGGGRTRILGMYGKLMFTTGEGYLFGTGIGQGRERWSFVWREELRFDDDGNVIQYAAPQLPSVNYTLQESDWKDLPADSAVAYRMWTPHPRFSAWPDSPMQAVLQEAEELLVLSSSVMATATSRLVRAPLLCIPEEIAPTPPTTEGDEAPFTDPFLQDFTDHLTRGINEPAAPASLAPYVLYAGAEWIEKIKPVFLHDTQTDYLERDLRTECIRRIARGLDLPPEVVEGMSDANHWAAWWISDDMWRSHGAPIAEQFCDDLSEAYLRPALEEAGFERWADVVVAYDASAVVVNPDRSKDADQAFDRGAIGYKAYRAAKNFKEEDAQSEEEHLEWLAKNKVILDDEGNPIPATGGGAGVASEEAIAKGDDPGAPDGQPGDVSEGTNLPASAAKFQGAAEMALLRCRELAGSRLRTKRQLCPHCLDEVKHLPNTLVASGLGRQGMEPLGAPDPRSLVAGGSDAFKALLLTWDYDEAEADAVCRYLELHAARTLFSEHPSIPSFHAIAA